MNGTEKFIGKADIYDKYRPVYPVDIIRFLAGIVKSADTVADIGAGTGKFTKMLCHLGCNIIAVEPNTEMALKAEENLQNYSNMTVVMSSAEDTMLADESVNLVTCAQSFHWFDTDSFRRECRRILKIGGKAMLIWNTEDYSTEIIKEKNSLAEKYCKEFSDRESSETPLEGSSENIKKFFGGEYQTFLLRNDLTFDRDSFVGYELSRSYAPKKGDKKYEAYSSALKAFFESYQTEGKILIPNITECYFGTVL
jgi:ubiquinone/menaquinone biosynthesis C-methylase UbiE